MTLPPLTEAVRSAFSDVLRMLALRLWRIARYSEFHLLEMFMGLGAIGWGIWLLNPAWQSFGSTPTFRAMASRAPEEVWGLLMLLVGCGQIVAAAAEAHTARRTLAQVAAWFWLFVSIQIGIANIASTGAVIYPVMLVTPNTLIFLRLIIEGQRKGGRGG